MNRILLDCTIYDKLLLDAEARDSLHALIDDVRVKVIATPMVLDELREGPFGGLPDWFPITIEAETVTVLDYAVLDMTRLGGGDIYGEHRGESQKIPDAIIADSADALADILVSEDRRCRERLKKISTRCKGLDYREFREWLQLSPVTA